MQYIVIRGKGLSFFTTESIKILKIPYNFQSIETKEITYAYNRIEAFDTSFDQEYGVTFAKWSQNTIHLIV